MREAGLFDTKEDVLSHSEANKALDIVDMTQRQNIPAKVNVGKYVKYLTQSLQNDVVGKQYQKQFPNNHIIFPERIQFLSASTGYVMVFVGQRKEGFELEYHDLNISYQEAIFGENIQQGKPAFYINQKWVIFDWMVIAQEAVQDIALDELLRTGGVKSFGDRLIDVGENADVTLLDCSFLFIRDGQYESLCQGLIRIFGKNYDFNRTSAASEFEHLKHVLSAKLARESRDKKDEECINS